MQNTSTEVFFPSSYKIFAFQKIFTGIRMRAHWRRKFCRTCETFLSSPGGQCLHSSPRLWGVYSSFLPGVWVSQRKTEREKGSTVLSKSSSSIPADRPAPFQYIFIKMESHAMFYVAHSRVKIFA